MKRQPKHQSLTRYIYVIGPAHGMQKVGLATDPRTRLSALQTACPFELVLHACVAVPFAEARAVEGRAHQLLAASRARCEWFETTPAAAVAAIHAAVAQTPPQPVSEQTGSPAAWRISPLRQPRPEPIPSLPRPPPKLPPAPSIRRAAQLALFDFGKALDTPALMPTPDTPIEALASYRLEVQCCAGLTSYPLRHLAASLPQGGRTALASALRLFRCERCRRTAREAVLVAEGRRGGSDSVAWRVEGPSSTSPSRPASGFQCFGVQKGQTGQ